MIESIYLTLQGTFLQNIFKVIFITIPIYLIILLFKVFKKSKEKINIYKCFGEFIFLGYIVTVLLLTEILSIRLSDFTTFHITPNLIPLVTTIGDLINYPYEVLEQILLNIVFFIPFGFLFTMLYAKGERKFLKTIVVALIFSISIETLEYFVGRYVDIDDILWNGIGAVIGSSIYILINNLSEKHKKIKRRFKTQSTFKTIKRK